jgi:hypothetical protein
MQEAAEFFSRGQALVLEAEEFARAAHQGTPFTLNDRTLMSSYKRLFDRFNTAESFDVYRQQVDACIWMHLITVTGMGKLMDRTARDDLYKDLCGSVPPVTVDNARALFAGLQTDAELIFQRGLARAFSELDRRFRSHDAFKIGSRIILTHMFNDWGSWNYHSRMFENLADIERVFAVLDQQEPDPLTLRERVGQDRDRNRTWQSVTETRYFRVKTYKNGNAHLWFTRDDLVEKANRVLAAYYGEVLPDAVERDAKVAPSDLNSRSGALSTELQFYRTPSKVMNVLLDNLYIPEGAKVLEPSAGDGAIVAAVLPSGAKIDAIEVDSGRAAQLNRFPINVQCANFLMVNPRAEYDYVIMNPPFYGTHWMEHVKHAFDFLKPGGTLKAILPATAEVGDTARHEAFRAWAEGHKEYYGRMFQDLPPESFIDSGTRVNTVILTLKRRS